MRKLLLPCVLVLLLAAVALADTVTKTDGTVIDGDVTAEDDASVTIKCKLGELKIPKSDVATVERTPVAPPYDADAALEELKKDVLKLLDEIRSKSADAKLAGKAKAAGALVDQVKAWSLSKVDTAGGKPKAESKALNYDDFLDGWDAVCAPPTLMTGVQLERGKVEFLKKHDGKAVRFSGELLDAVDSPETTWDIKGQRSVTTPRLAITVKSSRRALTFYVFVKSEVDHLAQAPKGTKVAVDGKLNTKGGGAEALFVWETKFSVESK